MSRLISMIAQVLFLSALMASGSAFAQTAKVERSSNLRPEPSMAEAPLRVLRSGEKVEMVGLEVENGYYKVRTANGEVGWVWARNVKTTASAASDRQPKSARLLVAGNMRSGPSPQQPAVRLLQPSESLKLLEATPREGYFHVQTADGQDGWIWGGSIVIGQASQNALEAARVAPPVSKVPAPPPPVAVAPAAPPPPVAAAPAAPPPPVAAAPVAPPPPVAAAPAAPPPPVAAAPAAPPPPVAAAPAAPAAVEQGGSADGLKPGDVLDKTTARLAKGMLPDEILGHYEKGEYVNPIVPYALGNPMWDKAFVEASKRNIQALMVNEHGTIIDRATGKQPPYLYGIPFPEIDSNDPQAAVKIIWNQFLATYYSGDPHTVTKLIMCNPRGVERALDAESMSTFFDGQAPKYRRDNPLSLQAQFLAFALSPRDMEGTASLGWRYRDPAQRDSNWAFVPALRRVRAVSPANRSDGLLGSDINSDDGYFFDGKPEDFDWRLVGRVDGLRMVDPEAALHKVPPKPAAGGGWHTLTSRTGYNGFEVQGWSGLPWALPAGGLARRPMWIIEARPHDKYYLFGRLVLWVDAETWDGAWNQKFAWTGEHVSTYQLLARINQPTGPNPDDETIEGATMAWAVSENFKMHRATIGGARVDAKSAYERRVHNDPGMFDAGSLVRLGK